MVGDAFHDSIKYRFLDVESRSSAATLSMIEKDGARSSGDCSVEIGILVNYIWRFAAKLERHFFQVAGCRMNDELPNFRGTGESYLVHLRMSSQSGARRFSVARNNIDDAFGEAGFHDQFAQTQRRKWSLFRRLQHYSATRSQRRSQLPRRHQ